MNHACGDRVNPNPRLPECCGGLENVDMSQMDLAPVQTLFRLMDFTEPTFCVAVAAIVFNPLFWNMSSKRKGSGLKIAV
uniref:Phosphatidylethanolamine N-methyltransferase n=1 Tax=Knipowitschia caucasica TaxID=637954 RepID=A0AAV2LPH6_KNICA